MSPLRRRPASPVPGTSAVRLVAEGRSSEVHSAVEDGTGRPVALKVSRPGGEHTARVRAVAAGHAAAGDHPHLLTLLRTSTAAGGTPALVLEACGPWEPPAPGDVATALLDLAEAAAGLAAAHAEGLVHGRLEPGKLLRTRHGAVVVTGVAPAAQATAASAPTPYTAPELLEGAAPAVPADVYGLAAVLHRALTGRDPFTTVPGEAAAALALRVLRDPVAAIVTAEVPLALSDVLLAALDKDPRRRPHDVAALLGELRAASAGPLPVLRRWSGPAWSGALDRTPPPAGPPPADPPPATPPPAAPAPPPPPAAGTPPSATPPSADQPPATPPGRAASAPAPIPVAERRVADPAGGRRVLAPGAGERREAPEPVTAPRPAPHPQPAGEAAGGGGGESDDHGAAPAERPVE